jgi:hypothetical protein
VAGTNISVRIEDRLLAPVQIMAGAKPADVLKLGHHLGQGNSEVAA